MEASARPWLTTGVALIGAGAIAITPISPITPARAMEVRAPVAVAAPNIELAALDIPYFLTLPIVRQSVRNWAENWAVYLAGLGQAGIGTVQSLLSIPGVTVEIIQEVFALNFVGAFDTFATAVRDSVVAVGEPLLDSVIWRNQRALLVEAALESAVPRAWIDLANGFLGAGNVVVTSLLESTENLVAAVLTFNLGNIIDAAVDGTRDFFAAVGEGARSIIDGIEAAQRGIADALATAPPLPPDFSDASTPAVDGTVGLDEGSAPQARTSVMVKLDESADVDDTISVGDKAVEVAPDSEDVEDVEDEVVDDGVDDEVVDDEVVEDETDDTETPADDAVDDDTVDDDTVDDDTVDDDTVDDDTVDDDTDLTDSPEPSDDATSPEGDEDTAEQKTPQAPKQNGADQGSGSDNEGADNEGGGTTADAA